MPRVGVEWALQVDPNPPNGHRRTQLLKDVFEVGTSELGDQLGVGVFIDRLVARNFLIARIGSNPEAT